MALFGVICFSLCGIVASKKLNLKSFAISDVLVNKKTVAIVSCIAIAIACIATITISSQALAEENHYEPTQSDLLAPVNVYVDKETGAISSDDFVIDFPNLKSDCYAIQIQDPALRAGNGFENLNANVTITDKTQNFDILDGCLNSNELGRAITLKRNDVCSMQISGIDVDTAKSLIGKSNVFYFLLGAPTELLKEQYSADVDLYVGE